MALIDQDSSYRGLLFEILDMMDTEGHNLNIIDQEKTAIMMDHDQNQELYNLQRLPSIAVLDVVVDSVTR